MPTRLTVADVSRMLEKGMTQSELDGIRHKLVAPGTSVRDLVEDSLSLETVKVRRKGGEIIYYTPSLPEIVQEEVRRRFGSRVHVTVQYDSTKPADYIDERKSGEEHYAELIEFRARNP